MTATELVEEVDAPQLVGDGHRVDRLALAVEREDGVEDVRVGRLVEGGRVEADLGGRADGVAREEHGPEERLLGLEVVRRDPSCRPPRGGLERLHHRVVPPRRPRRHTSPRRRSGCPWAPLAFPARSAPVHTIARGGYLLTSGLWIERAISLWNGGFAVPRPVDNGITAVHLLFRAPDAHPAA